MVVSSYYNNSASRWGYRIDDITTGKNQTINSVISLYTSSGIESIYQYNNGSYAIVYPQSDSHIYLRWLVTEKQAIEEGKIVKNVTQQASTTNQTAAQQVGSFMSQYGWEIGAGAAIAVAAIAVIYYYRKGGIYGREK